MDDDDYATPHIPVRSAITKAVVCRICSRVLATVTALESACAGYLPKR